MIEGMVEIVLRTGGRAIAHVLLEVVFEILIKGSGYLILKLLGFRSINPESIATAIVGIVFWLGLIAGSFYAYSVINEELSIDRCLDQGGAYNYQHQECEGLKSEAN